MRDWFYQKRLTFSHSGSPAELPSLGQKDFLAGLMSFRLNN